MWPSDWLPRNVRSGFKRVQPFLAWILGLLNVLKLLQGGTLPCGVQSKNREEKISGDSNKVRSDRNTMVVTSDVG